MKKFWSLLLSVAMVASLAACGGSSSGDSTSGDAANTGDSANTEAVHFKLSHPSAEGGPYDLMSKKFAELVEEKSGGKYVIDIFAANALGSQEEVLDAVSLGTLDMAVTSDDILAKYAPEWGYVGLCAPCSPTPAPLSPTCPSPSCIRLFSLAPARPRRTPSPTSAIRSSTRSRAICA